MYSRTHIQCTLIHIHTCTHKTPTHTHIQILQLSGDIEHAHHELDMGAEKYSDLQKKSEDQLHQLQVSFPSRNIPYLGKNYILYLLPWQ